MEGCVGLGCQAMHRPGVEPATSRSQVRRRITTLPNHPRILCSSVRLGPTGPEAESQQRYGPIDYIWPAPVARSPSRPPPVAVSAATAPIAFATPTCSQVTRHTQRWDQIIRCRFHEKKITNSTQHRLCDAETQQSYKILQYVIVTLRLLCTENVGRTYDGTTTAQINFYFAR